MPVPSAPVKKNRIFTTSSVRNSGNAPDRINRMDRIQESIGSRGAAMEIGRGTTSPVFRGKWITSRRDGGRCASDSAVPSERMVAVRQNPGTMCRANFQRPFRDSTTHQLAGTNSSNESSANIEGY